LIEQGCTPPLLSIGAGVVAQAASLQALDTGIVQLAGTAQVNVSGLAKVSGGRLIGDPGSAATLAAGAFELSSSDAGRGEFLLLDQMIGQVNGNVSLLPCGGLLLGCTPPLLNVAGIAQFNIIGSLQIQADLELSVTSTEPVRIGGHFDNASTATTLFDWLNGMLTLDGSSPQAFEAAGADLGPGLAGLQNNFAIGTLEIESGADVTLVNARFNTVGTAVCDEALYVRDLVLRAGSSLHLNNARLYYVTLLDEGAMMESIDCGELVHNATGDADNNGVIDAADYDAFSECMEGLAMDCQVFDFDSNNQIDLADFAGLQQAYGQ
jgi:hypothetical protein